MYLFCSSKFLLTNSNDNKYATAVTSTFFSFTLLYTHVLNLKNTYISIIYIKHIHDMYIHLL